MRKLFWGAILTLILVGCPAGGGGGKSKDSGPGSSTGGDGAAFNPDGGGGTGGTTTATTGPGPDAECTPGQKGCEGNARVQCGLDGKWSDPTPCQPGTVCSNGVCAPCQPGQKLCQGQDIVECDASGTSANVVLTCGAEEVCTNGICVTCTPGAKECRIADGDVHQTWECAAIDASTTEWQQTATCPEGADCVKGICVNPCQSDVKLNTNQGCDYYALDLQNSNSTSLNNVSPENSQFAVIVSNPSATANLTVTVHQTQKAAASETRTLSPGGLEIIKLGPRNIVGTSQGEMAWRVKGDRPFVAYQFNPLDNVNQVFSNDASLLLPVNALGKEYVVMTGSGGGAFFTIVGTKSETDVTVTVTHPTVAGSGIPALAKGETWTTTLGAGEVLNILAEQDGMVAETLTGSVVQASKSVAVFGGNISSNNGGRCCADHLEQQLFPTNVWGTKFVAAKSVVRQAELDRWRVVAGEDGTTVSFSGGVANPKVLNRGEWADLQTDSDFVVTADKPIMVGQFLAPSFEILPVGEYCESNNDCASGVCSGGENAAGRCVDTCSGSKAGCATNEVCLHNSLFSEDAPQSGGSCFFQLCGAGKPGCPSGSLCADLGDVSYCLATCNPFGGTCSNANMTCSPTEWGDTCVPNPCSGSFECSGGWCTPPSPETGTGQCWEGCNPQSNCPNPDAVCLPPGFANDPTVTAGLCFDPDCGSDADCDPGHTCVKYDANSSCEPIGDPAFILAVPVEQFRDDYTFLAPNAYKEDYVNVVAQATAQVSLDGQPIQASSFAAVPGSEFKVARVPLSDGTHRITASEPVGIVVYGYHDDVSYGYPGGANLFDLGD